MNFLAAPNVPDVFFCVFYAAPNSNFSVCEQIPADRLFEIVQSLLRYDTQTLHKSQ
ncbi:uncharacterized protein PHALS_07823 [Plasmopara halstedii]|uniref:Uncharacterized protein n=1 Tax=Plasmopara halstedii TaxID=4781 RepID=A0A0P1B881_PLAHL|nr:uncharacterized protein PHALS_07823 [Plasmopara halstedii]CEG50097.1 hypothetical protein PHALS_07823 [Plasmopara halstedii]|eukprot:XP_024586466.1 hypothetical protein PHALS_07823 [Plasmopara halstedii]